MTRTKSLKGECQHCAGPLEFDADMAGLSTECPHCHQQTELLLAAPPEEPTVPRRTVVWAIIGIVVLGLGFAASLVALKRAERWAASQKHKAEPDLASASGTNEQRASRPATEQTTGENGFVVSVIAIEPVAGTSRVYATGSLRNTSDRKRFGVKVELDLFDAADNKVGTATDYQAVMEAGADWRFKALALDSKATSAKIASIKEEQ